MWSITTIWTTMWTVNQYCNEKQNREWEKQCLLYQVLFRIDIWKRIKPLNSHDLEYLLNYFLTNFLIPPQDERNYLTPDQWTLSDLLTQGKEHASELFVLESHDIISHLHTTCLEPSFLFVIMFLFVSNVY